MKTIVSILLIPMMALSLLQAAAFEKSAKFRSIKALIFSEKPLSVGDNLLRFKITKSNQALKKADVVIKVFMPAMPGMPYMESKANAKALGNGLYEARINLPMRGTWQIHLLITTSQGKRFRLKSTMNL